MKNYGNSAGFAEEMYLIKLPVRLTLCNPLGERMARLSTVYRFRENWNLE